MIGLLTPFALFNYGTKLQAYAVQQTVSRFGEVEVIDYKPSIVNRLVHKPETMHYSRYADYVPAAANQEVDSALQEARRRAIEAFDKELCLSKPLRSMPELRRHALGYEAIVCGSDQIWNPVNLSRHIFMLEFAPRQARKVAYSPSFGIESLPKSLKATYRRRIANLDCLSVREESGLDILTGLGFEDAACTLDPTLVLTAEAWERLMEGPATVPDKPYLFCYFLGNRSLPREIAREVAKQRGLTIVNLPHFKGFVEGDENLTGTGLYDVSVQNFIWLIRHASAVCTDSFHGSAFSVQFGRDLYYCPRHESDSMAATNGRVASLLLRLGLQGRMVNALSDLPSAIEAPIDYRHAWDLLESLREDTLSYLAQSLGGLG